MSEGTFIKDNFVTLTGNVGIGSTNPNSKLSIVGDTARICMFDAGLTNGLITGLLGGGEGYISLNNSSGTGKVVLRGDGGTNYIAGGGNVGIGTTNPNEELTVVGDISASGTIYGASSTTNFCETTRYNIGLICGNGSSSRDKLRVWNNNLYTIGMQSGITFGALNDYAMTFQMNSDNDRGFWWGDSGHSTAQGAMSLTTNGYLTVASRLKVGGGESDTTTPTYGLEVGRVSTPAGTAIFRGSTHASHFNYSTPEDTYIRGGKAGSKVFINDTSGLGDVSMVVGGGDVGIGTASPACKLDVYMGANNSCFVRIQNTCCETLARTGVHLKSDNGDTYLVQTSSTYNAVAGWADRFVISANSNVTGGILAYANSAPIALATTNSNGCDLYIDTAGDVGIGTTNPSATLDVIGCMRATTNMYLGDNMYHDGDLNTWIGFCAADAARIVTGGSERMSVTNSAITFNEYGHSVDFRVESDNNQAMLMVDGSADKVGIGTLTPSAVLDVSGTDTVFSVQGTNGTLFSVQDDLSDSLMSVNDAAGLPVLEVFADNSICAGRYTCSDFYISSGGDIGIGNASPSVKLDVAGCIKATTSLYMGNALIHNGDTNTCFQFCANDAARVVTAGIERQAWRSANTVINEGGHDYDFRVEASSTASCCMGNNAYAIFVDAANAAVGIGTSQPSYTLEVDGTAHVTGTFSAGTKNFLIDHPTRENHMLRHGSLEGPENGVYVRGTTSSSIIELPEYWTGLVNEDTITVSLTPRGKYLKLFIKEVKDNKIHIGGTKISVLYDYAIFGERKDVEDLVVEFEKPVRK